MESLVFNKFKGTIPKIDNVRLPEGYAAAAANCDFKEGLLKSISGPTTVSTWASTDAYKTLYKYGSQWLVSTDILDIISPSIVPTSEKERRYFTGPTYDWPAQFDNTQWTESRGVPSTLSTTEALSEYCRLGIPDFSFSEHGVEDGLNPPYIDEAGISADDDPLDYFLGFTVVIEHADGTQEESVVIGSNKNGLSRQIYDYFYYYNFVDGDWSWPDFETNGYEIKYLRFYRLVSGEDGAQWRLTKVYTMPDSDDPYVNADADRGGPYWDVPIAKVNVDANQRVLDWNGGDPTGTNCSFSDTTGEVLSTQDFTVPPADMLGIRQFQNGMLIGFSGTELCVSEPHYGYAWPEKYKLTFPEDIVSLGVHNATIILTTASQIWTVTGSEPEYLTPQKLPIEQGCVSKDGTVDTEYGVIVPTPDGLFLINETDGINLTKRLYTKAQWGALSTSTLVGAYYDSKYYMFFRGSTDGIILDFEGDDNSVTTFSLADTVRAVYVDHSTDTMYLLVQNGSNSYIKTWATDTATDLVRTYTTRTVEVKDPCNYPWLRIRGDHTVTNYVTYSVYCDGTLKATGNITDNNAVRLPGGFRAKEWYVTVTNPVGVTQTQSIELLLSPNS